MPAQNYLAIARKWRPQSFNEVVGQEHITRTLTNALASGRIHHAFLFIGSRGIGKTTTARILAKALNCSSAEGPTVSPCGRCDNCVSITAGNNIDVIEIDGASNNTVEDVREIRENVRMSPTSGRYKVYIIDEVHQLSSSAFNALLKTLEEPPSHAIFILATTEAHKIPATIISRCQRYDFRRVAVKDIVALLKRVIAQESISASDEALHAIARVAEGGVRDAESVLDELITYCGKEIKFQDVFDVLGLVNWQLFHDLCDAMMEGNVSRQLEIIEEVVAAGKDLSLFVEDVLRYYRNLLICRTAGSNSLTAHLPENELAEMNKRAQKFTVIKLIKLVEQFSELVNTFDSQLAQRTALETLLIRLSRVDVEISLDTVMEKLILLGQGGIGAGAHLKEKGDSSPPNPKSAGTGKTAHAVPAENKRPALNSRQLTAQWRTLLLKIGQTNASLGLALGRARPFFNESSGLLELEFEPGAVKATDYFKAPENLSALQALLKNETENCVAVAVRQAPGSVAPNSANGGIKPIVPAREKEVSAAAIPRKDFTNLLNDSNIDLVVNEFKGVIVDVRRT